MKRITFLAIAATAILIGTAAAADDGDPAKGKRNFAQCRACHALKEGQLRTGPSLNCIVGRQAATAAKFRYSKSLKALGEKGHKWDEASLSAYLENPRDFLKKQLAADSVSNKMLNRYRNEAFRRDVIAYLKAEACK